VSAAIGYELLGYHETPLRVRFVDVDHYGYLWHGHLLAHFECLRADLARAFNLRTADLSEWELILPMLEATCVYKSPSYEDDELMVQGTVLRPRIPCPFLVLIYRVVKKSDGKEVARGRTRQVFMGRGGRLITRVPEVIQGQLHRLWQYLEERPCWSDAPELVRSLTQVGESNVVCPAKA
jgi:acyl-CoA thioester hydrolase